MKTFYIYFYLFITPVVGYSQMYSATKAFVIPFILSEPNNCINIETDIEKYFIAAFTRNRYCTLLLNQEEEDLILAYFPDRNQYPIHKKANLIIHAKITYNSPNISINYYLYLKNKDNVSTYMTDVFSFNCYENAMKDKINELVASLPISEINNIIVNER